jgi:hypothetical protein
VSNRPTYHPYYVIELEGALAKGGNVEDLLQGRLKHLVVGGRASSDDPDEDDGSG